MTTYSAIANGEVDASSPITDTLLSRLRNNPIAIAEMAPSAPMMMNGWHNYDATKVRSPFWVYSGGIAALDTPDFEAGYEYRVFYSRLTTPIAANVFVSAYDAALAAWSSPFDTGLNIGTIAGDIAFEVEFPRVPLYAHPIRMIKSGSSPGGQFVANSVAQLVYQSPAPHQITKLRMTLDGGANFTAGDGYAYRRGEYLSMP